MPLRHEIPTHLDVEDKAFFGLSVRQFMYLVSGLACSYAGWMQFAGWPSVIRGLLAGLNVIGAIALALVRPGGRGLDEWTFVLLRYICTPKITVWRPRRPDPAAWRLSGSAWKELTPQLSWKEDQP